MSSPNKITFNNNAGTSYSVNPTNFGYVTGEQVSSSYSPYPSANHAIGNTHTSSYQPQVGTTGIRFGTGNSNVGSSNIGAVSSGVNYGHNNLHIQSGLSNNNYGVVRDIHHPAPVTKITFGNKNYTQSYTPATYTQSYVAPAHNYIIPTQSYVAPTQTYENYQVYHEPTEVHTITSQPIRQQVRHEVPVQPVVQTSARVNTPVVEEKRKTKKGGCPSWLWVLLGLLALLGIIAGLLFLFGVFGKSGSGSGAGGASTSNNPNMYTVIDETVILSKDNSTPSGNTTTNSTTNTTTNNQDDGNAIDPQFVNPVPTATTYPTTTTTTTNSSWNSGSSNSWSTSGSSGSTGFNRDNTVSTGFSTTPTPVSNNYYTYPTNSNSNNNRNYLNTNDDFLPATAV